MIVQLSSGQGPAECELAVMKLFDALKLEYPDLELLHERKSRFSDGRTSVLFSTEEDLSELEGSVQWICRSPYRPNHGRKNWFVDVSIIPEEEEADFGMEVRFETFHSGGHGGQNVNKVETGIRVMHIPTGITVTSTAERSQYRNKQDALKKLDAILKTMSGKRESRQKNNAWKEHTRIVRGNPVRVYEGMDFRRKKIAAGII